jgi:murein DD-endopeptidase MepM/ murein hydrolase activator NlpD
MSEIQSNKIKFWLYSKQKPCICSFEIGKKSLAVVLSILSFFVIAGGIGLYNFFGGNFSVSLASLGIVKNDKSKNLDELLTKLAEYQIKLEEKTALIDAVIEDVKGLDHSFDSQPISRGNYYGGVGGFEYLKSEDFSAQSSKIKLRENHSTQGLLDEIEQKISVFSNIPIGAPVQGHFNSNFGWRRSPFSGRSHLHSGIDIGVDRKSPVVAVADGIVTRAGYRGAYGRRIVVDHGNGLKTLYGHLEAIEVKEGQKICRGQRIGFVGSSGRSTGPHLHYEIRVNGKPRDPKPFVNLAGFLSLLDTTKN